MLVEKNGLHHHSEAAEAIIEVWYYNGEIAEKCQMLVESMPNRVNDQQKARGGHIKNQFIVFINIELFYPVLICKIKQKEKCDISWLVISL